MTSDRPATLTPPPTGEAVTGPRLPEQTAAACPHAADGGVQTAAESPHDPQQPIYPRAVETVQRCG